MLHPIVINPDFLFRAKDDEEILNHLSSFIKIYKEYWKDIFILIDDEKNTLTKKYKEIQNKYGHESYVFNSILDFIISTDKTKKINLDIDISKKKIDYLLNNLKINKVKQIVTFPDYFEENKISLKDITEKKPFSKMSTNEALDRVTSITRFSKKVTLIDPMIPYTICNINSSYYKSHNNDLSKIKSFSDASKSDLIFSLNKLIKEIYDTNFFKKDLKINISTTIQNSKINHFRNKIEDNIRIKSSFNNAKNQNQEEFLFYPNVYKEKFLRFNTIEINNELFSLLKKNKIESDKSYQERILKSSIKRNVMSDDYIEKEIKHWNNIGEKIKADIEKCTSGIVESLNPNIVINAHFKDKKKDDEPIQDIYDRHILALDLDYSYEIRKGLDIFDAKKNKLKHITSWYIKLDTGVFEKSASYHIFSHPLFVPQKIIYN